MTSRPTGEARPRPLLSAKELTAGYSAVPVISGVSVDVAPGEIALVIGPNGAGKSTLIKSLNGELALLSGSVHLAGADISGLSENLRAARGLGYVPQSRDVFPTLTVTENLEMGGYRLPPREVQARLAEIFGRFPQLARLRKRLAQTLSGGERKLLAIARALVPEPTTLMLDEPTANLSPAVATLVLEEVVTGLAEAGRAILLIEQRLALALDVATWVYVLVDGKPRFSGSAASFKELPDMGAVFFASTAALPRPT
ncbi:MAG TPA: ABC transporter ATP-binding protein [Streptosporangiaceae bacterium]|nr:ABC transporter ATP-binding protein [Streptosporangiaceae bacterium]